MNSGCMQNILTMELNLEQLVIILFHQVDGLMIKRIKSNFTLRNFIWQIDFLNFHQEICLDILVQMKSHKMNGAFMEDFEQCNIDSVIESESKANHWKKALFQAVKNKISIIWRRL